MSPVTFTFMKNLKKPSLVFVILFLAFLTCPYLSKSQTDDVNRVVVSFGGMTAPEILEDPNDLAEALFSDGTTTSKASFMGTFNIQYDRVISEKYSVGLSLVLESIKKDVSRPNMIYSDGYQAKYFTILTNASYLYLRKEKLELYGRLGVGVSFSKEEFVEQNVSKESVLFAYQVSPIGVRLGKKFFFQAEAGFGYVGIISFGVGYRF
jgi:hypothetical protein